MYRQRRISAIVAATDGTAVLAEIHNRHTSLQAGMSGASNVTSRVAQIEIQIAARSSAIANMASNIQEIEAQVGGMMDAKLAAAVATLTKSWGNVSPPPADELECTIDPRKQSGARYRPSCRRQRLSPVESEDEECDGADEAEHKTSSRSVRKDVRGIDPRKAGR